MSTTSRVILQSVIAGLVAGLLLLSVRGLPVFAQWGDPEPEQSAPAEESAAANQPTTATSCELVTEADAISALGAEVTQIGDGSQCTYVADDLSGRSLSVAIGPAFGEDADGAFASGVQQVAEALGTDAHPVDLGDEAWLITSDVLDQLSVKSTSGEVLVVVMTMANGSPEVTASTLTDVAGTALSRM